MTVDLANIDRAKLEAAADDLGWDIDFDAVLNDLTTDDESSQAGGQQ